MFRVSFTGHRPEKLPFFSEEDPMCAELKERMKKLIRKLINDGAEEFFSGMAMGVDMWAAEIVLELKSDYPGIRLTAVVPCPEQADRWSEEHQERYRGILKRCDNVITTSPSYTRGCMMKRNRALVELCDVLVAVYDGTKGGTGQTVEYARTKKRKIEMLTPT